MPRASEREEDQAGAATTPGVAASGTGVRPDLRALARAIRPAATPAPAVAVCGWSVKDDASEVAAGVARALAHEGVAVTLVDWSPGRVHRTWRHAVADGASTEPGGQSGRATGLPGLRVIEPAAGQDARTELAEVLAVIAEVKRRGGCLVLDLPPLRDCAVLGQLEPALDGTLLVVRRDSTRRDDVRRAVDLLRDMSAPFLGVVLAQDSRPWWNRTWRRQSESTPRRAR